MGQRAHNVISGSLGLLLTLVSPAAHAQVPLRGADCTRPTALLATGEAQDVPPDTPGSYAMELGEIERIELELAAGSAEAGKSDAPMEICDPAGVPIAGELVPGAAGLLILRFTAPAAGRYVVAVAPAPTARKITLRTPSGPAADTAPLVIGRTVFARLGPRAVRTWSFQGKAGQWLRIAAGSETGSMLRLIGPGSAAGGPALPGDDAASEGRNPQIQRKLPEDGTYLVEVRSLGDAADDLTLEVRELAAQPLPSPSSALHPGTPLRARLGGEAEAALYEIAVRTGRSYTVEADAPFDLALDVGLADPLEPADGSPASGISVLHAFDATRSGNETATFTAAGDGRVLLRVRGLGVYEGGDTYTLMLSETGG